MLMPMGRLLTILNGQHNSRTAKYMSARGEKVANYSLAASRGPAKQEPVETPINADIEEVEFDGPTHVFDLTQLMHDVQTSSENVGSQYRTFSPAIVVTLEGLKTSGGCVNIHPSTFMRSYLLRDDIDMEDGITAITRKGPVDKILIEEATTTAKTNTGHIKVGVRAPGMRGRTYTQDGEYGRYVDVLPPLFSGPVTAKCVHKPSLTGLKVLAAAFSNYDEAELEQEYARVPGSTHWVSLQFDGGKTTPHILNGQNDDLLRRYGVDPAHVTFNPIKIQDELFRAMVLPRGLVGEVQERMIASREKLQHLNPTTSGLNYDIEFCPIGCSSWDRIEDHPMVKSWAQIGPEYMAQKMKEPFTLGIDMDVQFIIDDETTRALFNKKLVEFAQPRESVEQSE